MQNLKNCFQNVMFLTSENNQYRYNRLKGGTNAKCSHQGLIMTPKTVTNLQNMDTVNTAITNVDITKFLGNEGRLIYALGWQNYLYHYKQRLGQDSPLIKFTDCNENQQLTIDLP